MKILESLFYFSLEILKKQTIEIISLFCIIFLIIILIIFIIIHRKKHLSILNILKNNLPPKDFDENKLLEAESYYNKEQLLNKSDLSITNSIGMTFVPIPPGKFTMGSPENENGRDDDETQHTVKIKKGFYISSTPVTQGQWKSISHDNPSYFKNLGDDYPVENINWYEAQNFIKKLNLKEQTQKYRLPNEEEWEYACRADSLTTFGKNFQNDNNDKNDNNNDKIDNKNDNNNNNDNEDIYYDEIIDNLGWYEKNSDGITHPVAQKMPNKWGLYDIHGNVWEWCEDYYRSYTKNKNQNNNENESKRIIRGGSWLDSSIYCRSATRNWTDSNNKAPYIGFRLVRDSE